MEPAFSKVGPRIGIDVGGTKTDIVALGEDGAEIARHRQPTPKDYDGLMRVLRELALGMESRLGRAATIGIGFPGSPSPESQLWRNANMTFCNGRPLAGDIAAAIGREIRIENDANCFALSEASDGAGADHRVVFAATLGTGMGGGLVVDGRLHVGPNHLGGEWGHVPLPRPAPDEMPLVKCFCGLTGCAEQYVSGTGLARDFQARAGVAARAEEILRRRELGDGAAIAAIERFLDRLSRYLAVLVNIVDPDIVVLGGGLSSLADIYRAVPTRVRDLSFGGEARLKLVPAKHGASSGVRGAAWLWP